MSTSTVLERHTAPALRKRTKRLVFPSESESPGSQLPSPLSSVDDIVPDVCDPETQFHLLTSARTHYDRRPSISVPDSRRMKTQNRAPAAEAAEAQWSDIPLAVSLIPPLGAFLTGGDFLRDFLLFILLFFYLHQLIKLPWELYLASRPRGRRAVRNDTTTETRKLLDLAASELRTAEFCYLTLAVFAPLLGAALLRYVGTVLTGRDYISWFSTSIFVLVTGVRPWRHLGRRLRARTEELQDVIHTTSTVDLEERVKLLETEFAALRNSAATREDVAALDETLDGLDTIIANDLRKTERGRRILEERLRTLERSLEGKGTFVNGWTSGFLLDLVRPRTVSAPRVPPVARSGLRTGYRPRLASVREESEVRIPLGARDRLQERDHALVEVALAPFRIGKRLLWLFVDLLRRRAV